MSIKQNELDSESAGRASPREVLKAALSAHKSEVSIEISNHAGKEEEEVTPYKKVNYLDKHLASLEKELVDQKLSTFETSSREIPRNPLANTLAS
jgi:hypothetical protein